MLTNRATQPPSRPPAKPTVPLAFSPPALQPRSATPLTVAPQVGSLQDLAFWSALGLLFLRLSVIPELVFSFTGVNTYLLYLFVPSAILGAIATGAIGRTLQFRAARLWVAFFIWMLLATALSSWVGGSVQRVLNYGRVDFIFLFLGGLVLHWAHVRKVLVAIALAALVNVITGRFFGVSDMGGRLNLSGMVGSIGNSNDYAAHLLLVLPIAAYMVIDSKRNVVVRVFFGAVIGLGLTLILGTGSRGAVIGIALATVVFLFKATGFQRTATLVSLAVVAILAPLVLPASTLTRLKSLVGEEHVEAEESGRSREYLFKKSLEFTVEHPVFGVGPDQFANYEGKQRVEAGLIGNWHATHCAWTQVSSETGVPGLLLFAGGLFSAFAMLWRTSGRAQRGGFQEIRNVTLCFLTGVAGYLGAITFLSNAYGYYLPFIVGYAIAITTIANRYMDQALVQRQSQNSPQHPVMHPYLPGAPKLATF